MIAEEFLRFKTKSQMFKEVVLITVSKDSNGPACIGGLCSVGCQTFLSDTFQNKKRRSRSRIGYRKDCVTCWQANRDNGIA